VLLLQGYRGAALGCLPEPRSCWQVLAWLLLCLALYPGGSFEALLLKQATVDCHHRSRARSEQTSERKEQHSCSSRYDSNRSSSRGDHDGRKYFCHTVSCRQLKHRLTLAMQSRLCLDSVLMDDMDGHGAFLDCQPTSRSRGLPLAQYACNLHPAAWCTCSTVCNWVPVGF
jgi:hypothetical protein